MIEIAIGIQLHFACYFFFTHVYVLKLKTEVAESTWRFMIELAKIYFWELIFIISPMQLLWQTGSETEFGP